MNGLFVNSELHNSATWGAWAQAKAMQSVHEAVRGVRARAWKETPYGVTTNDCNQANVARRWMRLSMFGWVVKISIIRSDPLRRTVCERRASSSLRSMVPE